MDKVLVKYRLPVEGMYGRYNGLWTARVDCFCSSPECPGSYSVYVPDLRHVPPHSSLCHHNYWLLNYVCWPQTEVFKYMLRGVLNPVDLDRARVEADQVAQSIAFGLFMNGIIWFKKIDVPSCRI